jgi:Fe-S cluster assembly protein SufB
MTEAALKEAEIRDGVDRETIETVQAMAGKYKYGWETEIETEYAPKGCRRISSG